MITISLKNIFILLIITAMILFIGCDTVENQPVDNAWLKGTIENWSEGENKIIRLDLNQAEKYNFGSSKISSDGEFSINPITPAQEYIYEIIYQETYLDDTTEIYISNNEVRGITLGLKVSTENYDNQIGEVFEENEQLQVQYVYAESDLTIVGSNKYINLTTNDTLVLVYDLHYKKGWNKKAGLETENRETEGKNKFTKYRYTTNIPEDLRWVFYSTR